ncbi:hypothetical protein NDU88_001484 [Pleurodeles waltl]|uniref:Uncharacterized protein n=1 Tax=Pleurodeles waltl TaxID=8319 RepID=A0AAV7R797_PLEWA|nr:hypothetical protein NDU88_001484 [Pleurodeles waltl]
MQLIERRKQSPLGLIGGRDGSVRVAQDTGKQSGAPTRPRRVGVVDLTNTLTSPNLTEMLLKVAVRVSEIWLSALSYVH